MKKIFYYTPKKGLRNKADTAYVTIDWFKKKFRQPLNSDFFDLPYEERYSVIVPQLKWGIKIPSISGELKGVVESIIIDKTNEDEEIHILIQPYK